MMRCVVFLLLLLTVGCAKRKVAEKPALEQSKMIAVLVDIHLLEVQNQSTPARDKGRIYNTIVGYEKIFQRNKITAEQFYSTFEYYQAHPKEMDDLYQLVIDEVTRRESEISSEAAKERMQRKDKPDSSKRDIIRHNGEW